jgi:Mn2+/Fe2+ NRAMP family transporter
MRIRKRILFYLTIFGPGMVVMFADTDAGSVITAAQSGAVYGYKLLLAQFLLIPVLYIVQELTVRLGILTGKGHGELIKEHYGGFWAIVSVATMVLTCIGPLATIKNGLHRQL